VIFTKGLFESYLCAVAHDDNVKIKINIKNNSMERFLIMFDFIVILDETGQPFNMSWPVHNNFSYIVS